jgi:hypothetical protein
MDTRHTYFKSFWSWNIRMVAQLAKEFPVLYGTLIVVSVCTILLTETYPEQDECSPRRHILFLKVPL